MNKTLSSILVVIAGDITMDWNLARVGQAKKGSSRVASNGSVDIQWQRGGASLLSDLIEVVAAELKKEKAISISIRQPAAPRKSTDITPNNPNFHHSFSIWAEKKYGEKPPMDKERAWRVDEFLGLRRAATQCPAMKVSDDSREANIVVLDDANLGFRDADDCWPIAVNDPGVNPWIVLKMGKPVAQGPLWEQLHRQHAEKLIVVTTVDDLRLTEIQISRELSWERTAQDIFWELVHNPCVNALSHCAHVIVSFGGAGVILLSRQGQATSTCTLFFDPRVSEGAWETGFPGSVIGYTTCLTAGITRQLMINPDDPDIVMGIQSGLTGLRSLHADGYGEKGKPLAQTALMFPLARITASLGQEKSHFAVVEVQDPLRFIKQPSSKDEKPIISGFWTILQDRYQGMLDQIAEQIVRQGPEVALHGVPLGQFGNLLTVDRQEIESFRSIRSLVGEYFYQGQQKRPLSVAVFGPPGSGKSFGITEIANSLMPGQIDVREFNLSQFAIASDLISALHQVRDVSLSGKTPLVFWDEFDTTFNGTPLGWLRYFLAPMQDGRFQEGQISHPIGRCIFVFAGGTAACMDDFGRGLSSDDFRAVKGPDFVSRLKGYVNILGPNPVRKDGEVGSKDPYFIIRRAILLRSILSRNAPDLFEKGILNIDSGVLRALLQTRIFRHGVRSIESIIMMSQLAGKKSFERSSLPSEAQLDLHVDGFNFLALVQQLELSGKILEDLAEAAHEIYREGLVERGGLSYAYAVAYADLPEDLKQQNKQNVQDIPIKLASAGYAMIPARSNEPPFDFPGEALEHLAEVEHERWMQAKLANGWTYGPETNKDKKLNQCLVSWNDLPDEEKEKDRDLVRGIPKMLTRAGYAIVKTH